MTSLGNTASIKKDLRSLGNAFSRRLIIGTLLVILLNSACNLPAQASPPPVGTILPTVSTLPTSTLSNATPTTSIPITGMDNVVTLQCQFCVNNESHAVLILPEAASFLVSEPITGITCLTAQVVNGRRILICRGAQQAAFTLNVCLDSSNCMQLPVTLQPCPLIPQTGNGTPQPAPTSAAVRLTPVITIIPSAFPANTSTPRPAQIMTQLPTQTITTLPP